MSGRGLPARDRSRLLRPNPPREAAACRQPGPMRPLGAPGTAAPRIRLLRRGDLCAVADRDRRRGRSSCAVPRRRGRPAEQARRSAASSSARRPPRTRAPAGRPGSACRRRTASAVESTRAVLAVRGSRTLSARACAASPTPTAWRRGRASGRPARPGCGPSGSPTVVHDARPARRARRRAGRTPSRARRPEHHDPCRPPRRPARPSVASARSRSATTPAGSGRRPWSSAARGRARRSGPRRACSTPSRVGMFARAPVGKHQPVVGQLVAAGRAAPRAGTRSHRRPAVPESGSARRPRGRPSVSVTSSRVALARRRPRTRRRGRGCRRPRPRRPRRSGRASGGDGGQQLLDEARTRPARSRPGRRAAGRSARASSSSRLRDRATPHPACV